MQRIGTENLYQKKITENREIERNDGESYHQGILEVITKNLKDDLWSGKQK